MKQILILFFVLFSFGLSAQTLEIYSKSGGEGFRLIENKTDTSYVQKLTYDTEYKQYVTPKELGVYLLDYFGGRKTLTYGVDSVSVDGTTYGNFFDLTTKLDSIFTNFNSGGTGGGGATLYSSDGTLASARTVDMDGNDLTFSNGGGVTIDSANIGGVAIYTVGALDARFGNNALESTSVGFNSAFGYGAMQNTTPSGPTNGKNNVAVGYNAMNVNGTGYRNTAVGSAALDANVSGNLNTAIGYLALSASTGTENTAVGAQSLDNVTTGGGNFGLGYNAGGNISTGSYNIAIGSNVSVPVATADYQLNIGDVITGDMTSGSEALTFDGDITLSDYGSGTITGTATKFLAVDASGNVIEEDEPTTYWLGVGSNIRNTNSGYVNVSVSGTGNTTGIRLGDGDTGWFENADDIVYYRVGGSDKFFMNTTSFAVNATRGAQILNLTPSLSNLPYSFTLDNNTGMYSPSGDAVGLGAGGAEGLRIVETGGIAKTTINSGTTGLGTGLYFGDGDSGWYESADDNLFLQMAGNTKIEYYTTIFRGASAAGFNIRYQQNNSFPMYSKGDDTDSGFTFTSTADQTEIRAGGVTGIYVTESSSDVYTDINGGVRKGYVEKTATYTATIYDYTVNCTANTFTVTLPTAASAFDSTLSTGQILNIKNTGSGTITVDGNGAEEIDGATTQTLNQWDNLQIQSTGTEWIIL